MQLAGAVASNLSGVLGTAKTGRRRASAAGAAAGLAATFNTPLASIAFVLEEILGDLNSSLLGSVVVAAVLGAFVVHAFLGKQSGLRFACRLKPKRWNGRLLVPVVAVLATIIGVLFQKGALGLRKAFRTSSLSAFRPGCRPAFGSFFTWAIGTAVFRRLRHGWASSASATVILTDSLNGQIARLAAAGLARGQAGARRFVPTAAAVAAACSRRACSSAP